MKEQISAIIVDDSRIMRNIIKNYIISFGTEFKFTPIISEAEDGRQAIALLGNKDVDIAFLDWNMPQFSGLDFLQTIKTMEKCKNLPVIMITSEASKENIITALKEGAADYVVKPIDEVIFRKKVMTVLEKIAEKNIEKEEHLKKE